MRKNQRNNQKMEINYDNNNWDRGRDRELISSACDQLGQVVTGATFSGSAQQHLSLLIMIHN